MSIIGSSCCFKLQRGGRNEGHGRKHRGLGVGILARGGATGLGAQKVTIEVMSQRGSLCCNQGLRIKRCCGYFRVLFSEARWVPYLEVRGRLRERMETR